MAHEEILSRTDFFADASPDAYERLVDRLLASPHYGEKWGRHWLDVVRYAESNGYERDSTKPFIWRYRDYVVDAVHADKPFDRFLTEQIAEMEKYLMFLVEKLEQNTESTSSRNKSHSCQKAESESCKKRQKQMGPQQNMETKRPVP